MKLLKILLLSCAPMVLFSCGKDKTTPDGNNNGNSNAVAGYALDNSFHYAKGGVLAVQSDGKVINAISGNSNTSANATIIRLNKDGSTDNSFTLGSGLFANPNYSFNCVAIQNDGKILVGFYMPSPNAGVGIIRLNADGSKDNSFTVPAITKYSSNSFTPVYAIVPLSDGSAYIGGSFNVPNGFHLAKISASGVIDNSFKSPIVAGSQVSSLALQPDGKLVAAGEVQVKINGQNRNFLIRMDGSGTVDAGFNQTLGFYSFITGSYFAVYPSKVQLQPNGKLLVSGQFGYVGASSSTAAGYPGLVRFNTDGSIDASFQPESGGAIYPVADDKILIGKTAVSLSSPPKDFFTALDGSGKASAAFNSLGLTEASVTNITKMSETEFLLTGYFNNGSTTYNIIKVKKQ